MSSWGGDQGAYGPNHAQFKAAVGVERVGYASIVVGAIGGGGGAVGEVFRVKDRGGAKDNAIIEGWSEICTPFEEDTVFDAKLAAGELDPEEANLVEVFEDLSGGVVRDAGVWVIIGADGNGGGWGGGGRGWAFGAEKLAEGLDGLNDSAEDEAEEVPERAAGLVGGGGGGRRVVVGDDAVDADDDVFDLGDEGVEAARNDAAAA